MVLSDWDLHDGANAFEELPAHSTGEEVQVRGGYHDAGDYDRRIQHLAVVDALVDLYELFPERFSRDDLGIPESGNGLPDVLDEAGWAHGLYAQLQDEAGGVRGGVETTGHPGGWDVRPEDDTETTWYAYAVDPRSSYRFAGASAKLARALEAATGPSAVEAGAWLARARRAFAWAEAHPPAEDPGWLGAYAAAELLRTTGDAAYDEAFQRLGPFADGNLAFTLADWDPDAVLRALYAYARAPAATEPARAAALRVLGERADALVRTARGTGYRVVKHPYAPVVFGSLTTPTHAGLLLRVHALTGRDELLEWGTHGTDATLGCSAAGRSWVTGLGTFPPEDPLHLPSMNDGIDEPAPGLTVFGPARDVESAGVLGAALAAYEPPAEEWPPAERYVDIAYVPGYSEFTVHESIAPTVFAFGYLARLASAAPQQGTDAGDAADPSDPADVADAGDVVAPVAPDAQADAAPRPDVRAGDPPAPGTPRPGSGWLREVRPRGS